MITIQLNDMLECKSLGIQRRKTKSPPEVQPMLSCSYSDNSLAPTMSDYCQSELHLPEQCLYLMKYYLQIIDSFIFASHHYFLFRELKQKC